MRNYLCSFGPLAVFLSDSFARTAVIGSAKMLLATATVRFGKLRCSVEILSQSPLWAVASTGRRNTLIFRKRWSVLNEVPYQDLLFG